MPCNAFIQIPGLPYKNAADCYISGQSLYPPAIIMYYTYNKIVSRISNDLPIRGREE